MSSDPVRFLLVDDLEDNLNALEGLLRRDGLDLQRARSGAEALERMLSGDYALALLDVQMPDMDGYELAELMRSTERTRKIPIIFLTAAAIDERRRFRGYEAGAVDYITKPIDPLILKWKAQVFFELGQQAKELARQRDEMQTVSQHLATALARLRAHVDNSPLAVVEFDNELVIRHWSQGAERMFGRSAEDVEGQIAHQTGWLESGGIAPLREWISALSDAETPRRNALSLTARHADGHQVACECYGSVVPADSGAPQTINLQILDVSERLRAEETRSLLIGELNHRVKNTLANVQAIARQTLQRAKNPDHFIEAFTGRLQAFASAHSLLSAETWAGADLIDLAAEQMRLGALSDDRIRVVGPSIRLSPAHTLRLALTLHELTTNALKYGALSSARGHIDLSWEVKGDVLCVHWAETGGPPVARPMRLGFGFKLIETNSAFDGGEAIADWRPEGVVWTMRLSLKAANGDTEAIEADDEMPSISAPPSAQKTCPVAPESVLARKRLLIVEDEVLVSMEMVAELEDAGAQVVSVVHTAKQALDVARRGQFDVAILDGNLGGEPVDAIAEALAERDIPFCFVSGYRREHLPAQFQHIPIVEKPFDANHLRATLGNILLAQLARKEADSQTMRSHTDRR